MIRKLKFHLDQIVEKFFQKMFKILAALIFVQEETIGYKF